MVELGGAAGVVRHEFAGRAGRAQLSERCGHPVAWSSSPTTHSSTSGPVESHDAPLAVVVEREVADRVSDGFVGGWVGEGLDRVDAGAGGVEMSVGRQPPKGTGSGVSRWAWSVEARGPTRGSALAAGARAIAHR